MATRVLVIVDEAPIRLLCRVNLEAVLEPDEDNDGYGDFSQDLCPGSPIALSACAGGDEGRPITYTDDRGVANH